MRRSKLSKAFCMAAAVSLSALSSCSTTTPPADQYRASLSISSAPANTVDNRLFGHMLQKTEAGSPGPELIVDQRTGKLPTDVVKLIKELNPGVIRFSSGVDADHSDWRNSINNAPKHPRFRHLLQKDKGGKNVGTRLGIDEFCRFRQELGCEAILVVNLLDGMARQTPVREAAESAAGLVAYCNAPEGRRLPASLAHWPGVRAQNGNPVPFHIEYVELGNELWSKDFTRRVREALPKLDDKAMVKWYIDVIKVYIQRIRSADPGIKIILSGDMGTDRAAGVCSDKYILENVDYLSWHQNVADPLAFMESGKSGTPPTQDDLWNYWVTSLGARDKNGLNVGLGDRVSSAAALGKPVACTEWSWKAANTEDLASRYSLGYMLPATLACGTWLNGLIRSGDTVKIGVQSMLLGGPGTDTTIRIGADKTAPVLSPAGQLAALYAGKHGDVRLEVSESSIPAIASPIADAPPIALLDITATHGNRNLYIHAVNISRTKSALAEIRCSGFKLGPGYEMFVLAANTQAPANPESTEEPIAVSSSKGAIASSSAVTLQIPPASVSITIIPLR